MCGRFAQYTGLETLEKTFDIDVVACDPAPDYNIAPSREILTIIEHEGKRRLGKLEWGLLPFWAKSPSKARRPINARTETAHEKPTFRKGFRSRRCLIPADGFYEWRKTADGAKQPFFIQPSSISPFAFAGIWDVWKGSGNSENPIYSCAILTTASAGALGKIHDRMPVILNPDSHSPWLDPTLEDVEGLRKILAEGVVKDFSIYPVSRKVNSVKNNGEDLIQRVSSE